MELRSMATERFDIGRAVILRAPEWDGTTPLFGAFEHIGTTEGEVDIASNPEYSDLTIEVTGPAILKRYLNGESPSFEIGVYPDPEKMAMFSPSGTASAGTMRRRLVRTHTLWIVPEQLFLATDPDTGIQSEVPVTYVGGEFLKDGEALSADDEELLAMSTIIWRAQFERLTARYSHDDGGKSLRTVTVTALQDLTKPDGAQLMLSLAELDLFQVDFDPTVTPPE